MTDNNQNDQKQIDRKLKRPGRKKAVRQTPPRQGRRMATEDQSPDQNDDADEKKRMVPDKIGPGVPAEDK